MPLNKTRTIYNWKRSGLIYDDYNELYEVYIKTMNCQHCNKEFKNSKDRCMDHEHSTGNFRAILCQKCNIHDSYINYPNGYSYNEYYKQNREQIIKRLKENKYNCGCGSVIPSYQKKRHEKSIKHTKWLLNNIK